MSVRKRYQRERNLNEELLHAVQRYDTRNTEALLAEGANMNSSYEDWPVIFVAFPPNLELLLTRGANVDQQMETDNVESTDLKGMTALNYLCNLHNPRNEYYNYTERIRILLHHHADPNLADKKGKTPLHRLCEGSMDPAIIRLLIDHGADVNQVDNESKTPLHYLAGNPKIGSYPPMPFEGAIRMLLDEGANPLLKNDEGRTASDVAQDLPRSLEMIRLLKQAERNAGANVVVPNLPVLANENVAHRQQIREQILAMPNWQNEFNEIPRMNQAEFNRLLQNPPNNNANVLPNAPAPPAPPAPAINHIHGNVQNVNLRNHGPSPAPAAGGRRSRKHRKGRKSHKSRKGRKAHKSRKVRKAHKTRRH